VHYSQEYFNWQKNLGAFGGIVDLFKFSQYIQPTDRVLDFGCGGAYLLANVQCEAKAGIEINPAARAVARAHGITVYEDPADVPDGFATVVISNHALEHVEFPVGSLRSLAPKLVPGGKAVFVVPHEGPLAPYKENDINQHLYTWNPLTFGNLFGAAGYTNIRVDLIRHKWPPNYTEWYACLGPRNFHRLCQAYAIFKNNYQVRAVVERPVL
jgi:SAM-dependent methyltransferase